MEKLNNEQRFAEFARLKIDQQIARICVWAVHRERIRQGRILAALRDCVLSEEDVYEVASFFRKVWQIDSSREKRNRCFLCSDTLPEHWERLCHCFLVAEVGTWIEPTPKNIAWLKQDRPHDWFKAEIETYNCKTCKKNHVTTAGRVAARFRKGHSVWKTPKFCTECYEQRHRDRPRARRPQKEKAPRPPTLGDLTAKVAHVSPPTAES